MYNTMCALKSLPSCVYVWKSLPTRVDFKSTGVQFIDNGLYLILKWECYAFHNICSPNLQQNNSFGSSCVYVRLLPYPLYSVICHMKRIFCMIIVTCISHFTKDKAPLLIFQEAQMVFHYRPCKQTQKTRLKEAVKWGNTHVVKRWGGLSGCRLLWLLMLKDQKRDESFIRILSDVSAHVYSEWADPSEFFSRAF